MRRILQQARSLGRRQFLRRSAAVAVIRAVSLVLVFAMQVLLARLVGDSEEYGKYAWGQSLLYMVGTLAAMGLPVVTGRFIASVSARGLDGNSSHIIRRSQVLLLYSTGATTLIAAAVYLLSNAMPAPHVFAGVASLALLLAPIQSYGLLYQNLNQGRHWMVAAFLPLQVIRPLLLMAMAYLAWRIGGVELDGMLLLALVGCSLLLTVLAAAALYHARQRRLLERSGAPTGAAPEFAPDKLMRTARPVFASRLATQFIEYSNILLVGFLGGPAAAATYFAAERLAILAKMPGKIFGQVAQPEFAGAWARGDEPRLKWLVWRTTHIVFWPTAAGVIALVLLATPLLTIFGEEFASGRTTLILLSLAALLSNAFGPGSSLLIMTGRQAVMPKVHWSCAVFHGACLALLVPRYGASGAALTTLLSAGFNGVWLTLLVRRHLEINPTVFTPVRPGH